MKSLSYNILKAENTRSKVQTQQKGLNMWFLIKAAVTAEKGYKKPMFCSCWVNISSEM